MILRSIEIENWRCFRDPVRVGEFADGLSVIHAPNATGKSTLFEALSRALFDRHRVTAGAVQPWGRSLAPLVTVEFAHGGVDYRIAKRFIDGAMSRLERREAGRYERLHEGDDADRTVREMLTHDAPGRGLSKPEHWGLAQVLWAPQGDLRIALSDDVQQNLRSTLGTHLAGTAGGPIEDAIGEMFARYFTPTGALKTGREAPRAVSLRADYAEAQDAVGSAREKLALFDDAVRRVEDLRSTRDQSRKNADAVEEQLKKARGDSKEHLALLAEERERSEAVRAAEALHSQLKARIESIESTGGEIAASDETIQRLDELYPAVEGERAALGRALEQARKKREEIRAGERNIETARTLADAARKFTEHTAQTAALGDTLERIDDAQRELSDVGRERIELVAPDRDRLRKIRKTASDRDAARARVEGSLIHVEIAPESDAAIRVLSGEDVGERNVEAGGSVEIKGSPEVVADLIGIARIRARGPEGSVTEHRTALDGFETDLGRLTEEFGTSDLDALEGLAEQARELDARIEAIRASVETLLHDSTRDALEQDRARLESVLAVLGEQHPEWVAEHPDESELRRQAEEVERTFAQEIRQSEVETERLAASVSAATTKRDKHRFERDQAVLDRKRSEQSFRDLTDDGQTDEERRKHLEEFALGWDAARTRLTRLRERLQESPGDPEELVKRLETQLRAMRDEETDAIRQEERERGSLERLAEQGPYTRLAEAEDRVARVERDLNDEERRTNAIKLLHETVLACRKEAMASISGPIESAATRIFHRIAGGRLGNLLLDDALTPDRVSPATATAEVKLIDGLSGGEREQSPLAARLALAEVLARDERQLAVLDDVLIFTDAGRFARVLDVLEEMTERLQIVVLTCHPERYYGLGDASFIDLKELARPPD